MDASPGRRREEAFRHLMACRGIHLDRPARSFRFRWATYRPDFLDRATETYYEVIGTRQRASALYPTLDLMAYAYPDVRLVVVTPDGREWTGKSRLRDESLLRLPYGEQVIARMRREYLSVADLERWLVVGKGKLGMAIRCGIGRHCGPAMHAHILAGLEAFAAGRREALPYHQQPAVVHA